MENVTDQTFQKEVLESKIPTLVDFWADWCNPCKMIAPVIEELSVKYAEKIKIVKMNANENPVTLTRYQVRGLPFLAIFKEGKMIKSVMGAVSKNILEEILKNIQ